MKIKFNGLNALLKCRNKKTWGLPKLGVWYGLAFK